MGSQSRSGADTGLLDTTLEHSQVTHLLGSEDTLSLPVAVLTCRVPGGPNYGRGPPEPDEPRLLGSSPVRLVIHPG